VRASDANAAAKLRAPGISSGRKLTKKPSPQRRPRRAGSFVRETNKQADLAAGDRASAVGSRSSRSTFDFGRKMVKPRTPLGGLP
jgi:hypothetical protein